MWCLANEGYLLDFIVYQGKTSQIDNHSPTAAMLQLVKHYHGFNHLLVMDGLFSSPELYNTLLSKKVYCLGVVRPYRVDFPKSLVFDAANLPRLEWKHRQKGHLVAYLFVDKTPVYFLTTAHTPDSTTPITRHHYNSQNVETSILPAIEEYNKQRSNVDTIDQLATYYTLGRRTKRWWLRLGWWLIEMSLNNSWRLFQLKTNTKVSSVGCRTQLMLQLTADKPMPFKHNSLKRSYSNMSSESLVHLPRYHEKPHRCYFCTTKHKHKTSHYYCQACNTFLCIKQDCFFLYHKQISEQ